MRLIALTVGLGLGWLGWLVLRRHRGAQAATESDDRLDGVVRRQIDQLSPEVSREVRSEARDGIVVLRGHVYNVRDLTRLTDAVRSIPGVRDVVNLVALRA